MRKKQENPVGILTFHEVFNPGAFLQLYSTIMILKELNIKAEVINYNTPEFRYKPFKKLWQIRYCLRSNILSWIDANLKNLAFKSARRKHFNIPDRELYEEDLSSKNYKTVFVGSDIVWDFKLRNDPVYFGQKLISEKLIALAPSCGSCPINEGLPRFVKDGIKKFTAVSARDSKTAELVEAVTGEKCKILGDPTFVWAGDSKLRKRDKKKYILVYMIPELASEDLINQLKQFREQSELPIFAIYYRHRWADKNIMFCDPFEWIEWIRNASYVITNTFHGTLFSIMTHSNFLLEFSRLSEAKTKGIISNSKLNSRVFIEGSQLSEILSRSPDYENADEYFGNESKRINEFIKHSL